MRLPPLPLLRAAAAAPPAVCHAPRSRLHAPTWNPSHMPTPDIHDGHLKSHAHALRRSCTHESAHVLHVTPSTWMLVLMFIGATFEGPVYGVSAHYSLSSRAEHLHLSSTKHGPCGAEPAVTWTSVRASGPLLLLLAAACCCLLLLRQRRRRRWRQWRWRWRRRRIATAAILSHTAAAHSQRNATPPPLARSTRRTEWTPTRRG